MNAIQLKTQKTNAGYEIAVLEFDLPNEKVNKLSTAVMGELKGHLEKLKNTNYKAVVFKSNKAKIFIAGADIEEIQKLKTADEVEAAVKGGQDIFNMIEDLPMPTVAIVHGACMGGGCELILSCDYRIASEDSSTRIGLPETQLGIIPGFGGCVRLPRVVGLQAALDIILAGKSVNGKKALKMGLVDYVIHPGILMRESTKLIDTMIEKGRRKKTFKAKGAVNVFLESGLGRKIVFKKAKEGVLKLTRGHYPAPLEALEVVEKTYGYSQTEEGRGQALTVEREHFKVCAVTDVSKNLIHVFYLTEMVKKQTGVTGASNIAMDVKKIGVLGAGTMGGGIAYVAADKGIDVRIKDISHEALGKAYKHARDLWAKLVKKKVIDNFQFTQKMSLVSGGLDYAGFGQCDVVIEAIVEDMGIKQKVIGETAKMMRADAIIATNTSSLSVSEMSKGHPNPENFAGMHFFSPVHKMPLVEVIRGEKSSDRAVSTIFELSKKMGKMPVVVKDGPGFLVNRLLLPYMAEAAFLLQEGMAIEVVDKAYVNTFGMPMGPFELMDSVGLDVCQKVLKIFKKAYPDRVEVSLIMDKLEATKRLGQKGGLGFYKYDSSGKKQGVDAEVYSLLGVTVSNPWTEQECIERGIFAMVNECSRALMDDKIVELPHEVDLAMIMGTGFPPFRGGLLKYADSIGLQSIYDKLVKYSSERKAKRLTPSPRLQQMASQAQRFYP